MFNNPEKEADCNEDWAPCAGCGDTSGSATLVCDKCGYGCKAHLAASSAPLSMPEQLIAMSKENDALVNENRELRSRVALEQAVVEAAVRVRQAETRKNVHAPSNSDLRQQPEPA